MRSPVNPTDIAHRAPSTTPRQMDNCRHLLEASALPSPGRRGLHYTNHQLRVPVRADRTTTSALNELRPSAPSGKRAPSLRSNSPRSCPLAQRGFDLRCRQKCRDRGICVSSTDTSGSPTEPLRKTAPWPGRQCLRDIVRGFEAAKRRRSDPPSCDSLDQRFDRSVHPDDHAPGDHCSSLLWRDSGASMAA